MVTTVVAQVIAPLTLATKNSKFQCQTPSLVLDNKERLIKMTLDEFKDLVAQEREAQRKENLAKSQALFATLSKEGK